MGKIPQLFPELFLCLRLAGFGKLLWHRKNQIINLILPNAFPLSGGNIQSDMDQALNIIPNRSLVLLKP